MEFDLEKEEWLTGPFLKLNFAAIDRKVNSIYMRDLLSLAKIFEELEDVKAIKVLKELRMDVEKIREKLWVIELLTTEAILKKSSIWKDIFRECSSPEVIPNDDMTLNILVEAGILGIKEKVEEISKLTEKQWAIEKKLNEIIDKMKELKITLITN